MSFYSYLKERLWNPVIAGIETLGYNKVTGLGILGSLKQLAPNEHLISSKMHADGFEWTSDPLGGSIDFYSYPWVTCAKKKGDCDDWSHVWYEVLRGYGERWILTEFSKSGAGHSMCVWQKGPNTFVLLSNLDVIKYASTREGLQKVIFGADTARSYFT